MDNKRVVITSIGVVAPSGLSLGLSVVQGVIKEHRGSIKIESNPRRDTSVNIQFLLIG